MPLYCHQKHENQPDSRFCTSCGEPLWLPVGHILEKRYRIVKQLSSGGFGRTYLAEDLHRFQERCVLKEFAPQVEGANQLQKAKELFEREAAALYQLKHPQLPAFREFFPADLGSGVACLFLAQDYIDGQTYAELLTFSRLKEKKVIQLMYDLLPVLSYIHTEGVIHRDISPDNLICRNSDKMPVLIDFGGVKQVAATVVFKLGNPRKTPTLLGKKGYSPDEQIHQGEADPSSDLYALAVTALVLLTGKEPEELYDGYQETWLWQREIKVSSHLETVLQKMLAKNQRDRYQSAAEVLQALQSPGSSISQLRTINLVGKKPAISHHNQKGSTQIISPPPANLTWVRPWAIKALSAGLIGLVGVSSWVLVKEIIPSISSIPLVKSSPKLPESARSKVLIERRQALGINPGFFNSTVNELFYAKYPQMQGRNLTPKSEDTNFRQEWYGIAEDLLNQLEAAKLSPAARRKLGRYTQQDYANWQQQVKAGKLGSYRLEQLNKQTNEQFYQLFPQQWSKKLNINTFGQIWYAIAADYVSVHTKK